MRFVLLLLFLGFSFPAHAHRPYLLRAGNIAAPDGSFIITERLYGDGIIFSNPVRFQLRSQNGALLAYSKTAGAVAAFCPSISFCWVFPHQASSILARGWQVDVTKINLAASPDPMSMTDEEAIKFQAYLEGKADNVAANAFGYPEEETSDGRAFSANWPSMLISPIIIIAHHYTKFLFFTLLLILTNVGIWFFFKRPSVKALPLISSSKFLGIIILIPLIIASFLLAFISIFYFSTPSVYLLLFAVFSIWLGNRYIPLLCRN